MSDKPKLYITGIGMITPVGSNAEMTTAAVKAGISSYRESDFFDKNFNKITISSVTQELLDDCLDEDVIVGELSPRHAKMLQLAKLALVQLPNDDTNDDDAGLDEDENLHWPDVVKVTALWRNHGQHFMVGQRRFMGKPITADLLNNKLTTGTQRLHHAAAMELALTESAMPFQNTQTRMLS